MSLAYAKISDCLDIVPVLQERDEFSERIEASLQQSLLDASRLFESDVFAPVGYFKAAGETFEPRQFYSNGTEFIRLAPYAELQSIEDNESNVIDAEEYRLYVSDVYAPTGYFLRWQWHRYCGYNWRRYSPISVTARWGFPCVPPDVALAVKGMGGLMFLSNPNNRVGQVSGLDDEQATRLRNTYNRIVSNWQDKFHHFNLGVV